MECHVLSVIWEIPVNGNYRARYKVVRRDWEGAFGTGVPEDERVKKGEGYREQKGLHGKKPVVSRRKWAFKEQNKKGWFWRGETGEGQFGSTREGSGLLS